MNDLAIKLYQTISSDRKPRDMKAWHASQIAACPRAHYYARLGLEALQKPTGAKILRWDTGHAVEASIRPHLVKLYPNLVSNVRFFNKELDLTGELDNYDPDSKTIIEIKSVHPQAVRYRRVAEDRNHLKDDKQYLHHEYQQHAYELLMNNPTTEVKLDGEYGVMKEPWKVEKIIYLYISLAGLLVPYETEVNPEITQAVTQRLKLLQEAWSNKTPPPCFCGMSGKLYDGTMQYCDYRTIPPDKNVHDPNCCNLNLLKEKTSE